MVGLFFRWLDVFVIGVLVYTFRPRGDWPELYGMSITSFMRNVNNRNGRAVDKLPIVSYEISNALVFDLP